MKQSSGSSTQPSASMRSRSTATWLSIVPSCACLSDDTRAYNATRHSLDGAFMRRFLSPKPGLRPRPSPPGHGPPSVESDHRWEVLPHTLALGDPAPIDWFRIPARHPAATIWGQLLASCPLSGAGLPYFTSFSPASSSTPARGSDEKPAELPDQTQTQRFVQDCLRRVAVRCRALPLPGPKKSPFGVGSCPSLPTIAVGCWVLLVPMLRFCRSMPSVAISPSAWLCRWLCLRNASTSSMC